MRLRRVSREVFRDMVTLKYVRSIRSYPQNCSGSVQRKAKEKRFDVKVQFLNRHFVPRAINEPKNESKRAATRTFPA